MHKLISSAYETGTGGDFSYLTVYWNYLKKLLCLNTLQSEIFYEVALQLIACLNSKHFVSENKCEFISPTELSYMYKALDIVHS